MSIRVLTMTGEIKFEGDVGPRGLPGETGPQGNSLEFTWDGTRLGIRVEGQSEYTYVDLEGPQGTPGRDGTDGTNGKSLEFIWNGTTLGVRQEGESEYSYSQDLKGQKGDQGIQGLPGTPGATGNGISSVSLLSTEGKVKTYRILFTNGNTFDFQVSDGEDGSQGTLDYEDLINQPQIAGNTLVGNKSLSELGIASASDLSTETTTRQNADLNLQDQIDALASASDVIDVVGTYAELQAYDTTYVNPNDIIKVLTDNTHDNAITYYRWVITDNVGAWVYVGSQGPFYTKGETDTLLNGKVDKVTGKGLSTNDYTNADKSKLDNLPTNPITQETDPTVPAHVKAITQQNISSWNNKSDFSGDYNDLNNKPTIPTKTSDLTNDSGFIDSTYHDTTKQDTLVSGTNIKTINNQSILGSGNIDIQGGGGNVDDVKVNGTSVVDEDKVANVTVPVITYSDVDIGVGAPLPEGNIHIVYEG